MECMKFVIENQNFESSRFRALFLKTWEEDRVDYFMMRKKVNTLTIESKYDETENEEQNFDNVFQMKEGEEEFIERATKVKRYGAAVIVMAFDEDGQADSYERRIEICERSYRVLVV